MSPTSTVATVVGTATWVIPSTGVAAAEGEARAEGEALFAGASVVSGQPGGVRLVGAVWRAIPEPALKGVRGLADAMRLLPEDIVVHQSCWPSAWRRSFN